MVIEHDIRIRSYLLWEAAGRPQGRDVEFWLRAEQDVRVEAGDDPKSRCRPQLTVVPGIPSSLPPHRSIAMRVPARMPPCANVAMR
jgi:Protein of unknown function (DUF2934)